MPKKRRLLNDGDFERMEIPKRFRDVSVDKIEPENSNHKKIIVRYILKLNEIRKKGIGLLFWGDNGVGKTACASLVLKEARRRGFTCLFCRSFDLKDFIIGSDDRSKRIRKKIRSVDFLVIDDLGKEYSGESGFIERVLDGIFRERSGDLKPVIVTTNMSKKALRERYKKSMLESLTEAVYPVKFVSKNYRKEKYNDMEKFLVGEDK